MHLLFFRLHPHPCWGLGFEASESGRHCRVHEKKNAQQNPQGRRHNATSINKRDVTGLTNLSGNITVIRNDDGD